MKYREIYPNAPVFVELADCLFRIPSTYKCITCRCETDFLDYTFEGIPVPTCSGDCFQSFRSVYEYIKERVPSAQM